MKINFNVGGVVQLRSGGPLMTVTGVSTVQAYNTEQITYQRVWVVWFDVQNRLCSDELKSTSLEKIQ